MSMGSLRRLTGVAVTTLVLVSGSASAQQAWPQWKAYSDRFIDGQGRVIDHSAHDRTTSEGQAYAMFFALVANDRTRFDKLLAWTSANLAHGDLTLRLPAWLWGQDKTGQWRLLDENSASDADIWMVYTLLQAGKLWQEPRYEHLGRVLAARIAHDEVKFVPGFGMALIPGAHGFQVDATTYTLNPSYAPLPLLTGLMREMPQGPWSGIVASLPSLLNQQAGRGFAMDWLQAGKGGVRAVAAPAEGGAGRGPAKAGGSYDAIRVYLWLGLTDPEAPGLPVLLKQMSGMGEYLRGTLTPPLVVDPQGQVVQADAPVGFSAAVVPYLEVLGMKEEAKLQQDRMAAAKDSGSGLYGAPGGYYDQNLVLFSTGWSEERFRFNRDGLLRVNWK